MSAVIYAVGQLLVLKQERATVWLQQCLLVQLLCINLHNIPTILASIISMAGM